ncbi:MAG: histidine kinase [Desulfuromonadales bacterium]|nr:histidine kinase [Desulfuromonadales bacterium]
MRLPLKFKIILAPATVLLLLTLLLAFLQYTYWDMSKKNQTSSHLRAAFIALVEADMATKRLYALGSTSHPETSESAFDGKIHEELSLLYARLISSLQTIKVMLPAEESLLENGEKLNPERSFFGEDYRNAVIDLRSRLNALSEEIQRERERIQNKNNDDISEIVYRTTTIGTIVLLVAILIGVFIALTYARQILFRINLLKENARRIAGGDLNPLPFPDKAQDELDDLAISINRMTERLIRVVSTEKLLEGAEEERRRIARDLHDQTLADLSAVQRDLEVLHCGKCADEARRVGEDLRRAMANLRDVMEDLHPQSLDILGLGAALESFLDRTMSREGLPEYQIYISPASEELVLSRHIQLAIYRIALEAIHNVIRHAHASRYEVVIERRGEDFVLSVEDNGNGFNLETAQNGGRGLNNMRERARTINARISWSPSRFSSGTRFELSYNTTS